MAGVERVNAGFEFLAVAAGVEGVAEIAAKADAHSLSASSYLRRLGLAMPLQSMIDQRAILDLVKINADLGRFGGLIKMWLTTNADIVSGRAKFLF